MGDNSYEVNGVTYAKCGECNAIENCPIFGALVFPIASIILEEESPGDAIAKAIDIRDETEAYAAGGMVSYLQAVNTGDIKHEEVHPLPQVLAFALLDSLGDD